MLTVFSFKWAQNVFATEAFAQSFARILYAYMFVSKIFVTFTQRLRDNTPTMNPTYIAFAMKERKKERKKEKEK